MAIIRPNTQGQEQASQHPEGAIPSSALPEQYPQQPIFVQASPSFHQAPQQHFQQGPTQYFQQQPVVIPSQQSPQLSPWTTDLLGCFDDTSNCLFTAFCPCVAFGRIAEITSRGLMPCFGAGCVYCLLVFVLSPCFYSCTFRAKLRMIFELPEKPCGDCFVHTFCECCALCQEYRELMKRGVDPKAGWQAHAEKLNLNLGVPMASPIAVSHMMR